MQFLLFPQCCAVSLGQNFSLLFSVSPWLCQLTIVSQTSLCFYISAVQSFENTVGKREITCYMQFLLFPQCFLSFWRIPCHYIKFKIFDCKLFHLGNLLLGRGLKVPCDDLLGIRQRGNVLIPFFTLHALYKWAILGVKACMHLKKKKFLIDVNLCILHILTLVKTS